MYNDEIESAINTVDNYLKSIISNNTRWLSIKLLTNSNDNLLSNYLGFNINCDKDLLNLVNKEKANFNNIKKDINKELLLKSMNIYFSIRIK